MKNTLHFLVIIFLAAIFLSSCGGGDSISEIDLIPIESGNEYQYIDKEGNIVINPQFSEATIFREGLALVKTSGDERKYGFINEDGKYVVNALYIDATVFSDGLAWVVMEDGAPSAINKKGEMIFTLSNADEVRIFKDKLAAFSVVNEEDYSVKFGFVDKQGEVVINPQFSEVNNFSDGLCGVMNDDGKWGFIDKEGSIAINYQFDAVFEFKGGKCVVQSAQKCGAIDEEGKYIINPQFDAMAIDGDMFFVEQGGKYGWCDKDGKIVINPQFALAFPFNGNEITAVQSGKSFGYIDEEGKIVINPQFNYAFPFNGKLALVYTDKVGVIDREGKYIVNPQFDDFSEDYLRYVVRGGAAEQYQFAYTDYTAE